MIATDGLEQKAREQGELLRSGREKLSSDPESLAALIFQGIGVVNFLTFAWKLRVLGLRKGGAPAKGLLDQCDALLAVSSEPTTFLTEIARGHRLAEFPTDAADSIRADVTAAFQQLDSLVREIQQVRAWAASAFRISTDPEEIKRRVALADQKNEWITLPAAGH
jgi:hypothetical protein